MLYGCAVSVPMASSMDDSNAKKYIIKPDRSLIYLYRDECFGSENEVYGGLFICTCYAPRRTVKVLVKWALARGAVCVFRGSAAASQSWSTHAPKKWKPPEVGITACRVPSPADGKPLSRGDPSLLLDLSGQAPT